MVRPRAKRPSIMNRSFFRGKPASIRVCSGLKAFVVCVVVVMVAGCGGGGEPGPVPPDIGLPLMVDGLGRQVPEADFGSRGGSSRSTSTA